MKLTSTTTAGDVTAKENTQVSPASLLIQNATVDGVPNAINLEAHVENVTAGANSRVDVSVITVNGSTINGDLNIKEKVYGKTRTITAG